MEQPHDTNNQYRRTPPITLSVKINKEELAMELDTGASLSV